MRTGHYEKSSLLPLLSVKIIFCGEELLKVETPAKVGEGGGCR
jgi:hypothetical protein